MQNQIKLPGVGELLSKSFAFYENHWRVIVGISAMPIILSLPGIFLTNPFVLVLFSVLSIVAFIVSRLAFFALVIQPEGTPINVSGTYRIGARFILPFLWMSVLASLATLGGFFLLIVPGIIVSVLISFSGYSLFIDGRRGLSTLAQSWAYVKGYWWPVVGRFLAVALIIMIVAVLISVIIPGIKTSPAEQLVNLLFMEIFAIPLITFYGYLIYGALKNAKAGISLEQEESTAGKKIKIFAILGIVGIFAIIALGVFIFTTMLPEMLKSPQFNISNLPSAGILSVFLR